MNIDLSPTREKYYSQLNNELDPYIACQVTSMVMGLDIAGFGLEPINDLKCSQFKQPEDKLKWFMLNDPDVQAFWKRNYPDTTIPAPQWAGCMVFAINKLYWKSIIYFESSLRYSTVISDLKSGLPTYISMEYPENRNFSGNFAPIPGHIVLAVGVDHEGNILINDPYKNHLTGERDGFKNVYSLDKFIKHSNGHGIRYQKV